MMGPRRRYEACDELKGAFVQQGLRTTGVGEGARRKGRAIEQGNRLFGCAACDGMPFLFMDKGLPDTEKEKHDTKKTYNTLTCCTLSVPLELLWKTASQVQSLGKHSRHTERFFSA